MRLTLQAPLTQPKLLRQQAQQKPCPTTLLPKPNPRLAARGTRQSQPSMPEQGQDPLKPSCWLLRIQRLVPLPLLRRMLRIHLDPGSTQRLRLWSATMKPQLALCSLSPVLKAAMKTPLYL